MSVSESILVNWLLVFPFVAAAVIAAFPRVVRFLPEGERDAARAAPAVTAITAVALSLGVCVATAAIIAGKGDAYADYRWTPDFFQFRLRLDALGVYALLAIAAGLLITALWAAGAGLQDHVRWSGFAVATGAFTGVVLAADLVVLYAFWELSALALWVALAPAPAAGRRYLTWSHAGGACILVAILGVAVLSRDTHVYTAGPGLLIQRLSAVKWLALVLLVGLGVKLALAPVGFWLPDLSRRAQGPWDIALLGIALATAGYAAVRLLFYILPGYAAATVAWLPMLMGLVSGAYAGARALLAGDLREGAGYVLAAAAGQIAFGIGVAMRGGAGGVVGAVALVVPLAIAAPLLAAGAGAGSEASARRDARGSLRTEPARGAALIAGAWLLAGAPPLAGFWGQRAIVAAAWQAGPALGLAALIAPALVAVFAVRAAAMGFAGPRPAAPREPGWRMWWAFGVILLALVLGIAPHLWMPYVLDMARGLMGG